MAIIDKSLKAQLERARSKAALLEERVIMRECSEYQWLKSVVRRLKSKHAAHDLAERVDALAGVVAQQERAKKLAQAGMSQADFTDAAAEDPQD